MDVIRFRLANQHLTSPGLERASDVVHALGAVQAQDYAGAKWALAQRTRGLRDVDIEREVSDGAILRTHVLRPTWHFVTARDIRWMLALTAPRVSAAMASYNRRLELTAAMFRRSNDTITKALADGEHLTRAELAAALRRARIDVSSGQRLAHLVMQAELDGVVCSGPPRGKQFTYALLDARVPPSLSSSSRDRDEALLDLTRRYFATRGPATAHDFSWWSGLILADAKRGLAMARRELEEMSIEGRPAWFVPSSGSLPPRRGRAHLLPNYDEYFIGYRDRSLLTRRLVTPPSTRRDGFFGNYVFLEGQLVGSWTRITDRDGVVVRVTPQTRLLPAEKRRLGSAAREMASFLQRDVELRLDASS